jgi:hypothetical protein
MTAKKFLMRFRGIDNLLNARQEQIIRLRAKAENIKTFAAISKNRTRSNKHEECLEKIDKLETDILESMNKLVKIELEVKAAISEVDSSILRELLELRYLNFKKWEEIAVSMNYSYRRTMELHVQALSKIKIPH